MQKAIMGKKLGMTQIFDESGKFIPVTVVEAGPCTVVQKKTVENDGYEALQIGFGDIKEKKVTKPQQGHFKKAGVAYKRFVKELRLDGVAMGDFNPVKLGYTVPLKKGEKLPSVEAIYDSINSKVTVEWIGNTAKLSAVSRDPRLGKMNYTVNFEKEKVFSLPKGYEEIKIVDITASDDGTRGNTSISGVNDGRLDTRWAAEGKQWIMFDLGENTPLKIVSIAFYKGMERRTFFNIEISDDGKNFEKIYSGISTGATVAHENFEFKDINARYVRISGTGNTSNKWNNYAEVAFFR